MVYGYYSNAIGDVSRMMHQAQILKQYCKDKGYNPDYFFCDQGSGLEIREGLRILLDKLQAGDIVIVKEYSRLTRNAHKLYEVMAKIERKGARLEVVDNPDGIEDNVIQHILKRL